MKQITLIFAYVAVIGVLFFALLNPRVCKHGLDSCMPVFGSVQAPNPHYVAAESLDANHILDENDLARTKDFPKGGTPYLPDKNTLVGTYVRSATPQGSPLLAENTAREPVIDDKARCIVIAELNDYARTLYLFRAGSTVLLACKPTMLGVCHTPSEGTVVALVRGSSGVTERLLVSVDANRCTDLQSVSVVGIRK